MIYVKISYYTMIIGMIAMTVYGVAIA